MQYFHPHVFMGLSVSPMRRHFISIQGNEGSWRALSEPKHAAGYQVDRVARQAAALERKLVSTAEEHGSVAWHSDGPGQPY
jgi:hypothetical protein